METCCEGSGSGSGSGPQVCGDEECIQSCDQCLTGTTAVWELAATGYDPPIYLCHVEHPDDGNYCRWVSPDQSWELRYNYGDELWTLENYDTGDFFYTNEWDCDGENVLLNILEGEDSAVLTPAYSCTEVSYDCVDGECVGVSGTGGTYATLEECQAACGGGVVPTICCPDTPTPESLTATFSAGSGTMAAFDGTAPTLTYQASNPYSVGGSEGWYSAPFNVGGTNYYIGLYCTLTGWFLIGDSVPSGPCPLTGAIATGSCDPLLLNGSGYGYSTCKTGTSTITITT